MSIEDTKAKIAVMQAYVGGAKIDCKSLSGKDGWEEVDPPSWNWTNFDYRVAPPKPREVWHIFSKNGEGHGYSTDEQTAKALASHIGGTYAKFVEAV